MRVAIVGGGPAGLFFASLMKRHDPSHDIRVIERDPEGATYGWGVVLSDVALNFVKDVDPALHVALTEGQVVFDRMRIVHRGEEVILENNTFYRMARLDLLRALQNHCLAGGVAIEFGRRVTDLAEFGGFDLVVAADGANSTIRGLLKDRFQPSLDVRPNWLAWYGTPRRFDPLSLVFRQNADGLLIAHAYTYSPSLSTFLVETDPETFGRAGLGEMSEADSLRYCERVFADDLGGEPLLSNKSQWFRYAIVRNRDWFHCNVVLLGDALRTGHPSIGSGTRLAMQDSIALFRAFERCGADVPAALAEFERTRRPGSDELQAAAVKSTEWYETVRAKLHLHPVAFAYDYMRRTGRVSHEDLRRRDPALVAAYEALGGEARPSSG
jgi:2-polyprenyl-6-methoxyphenol hydroxylase-like FAD-dependent oxidoreductase